MAGNFAKDPLNASHGDSLVGQNFQSLKSKEVRDSGSPTSDLKFHAMSLNHPNTTGWDVQTSSEVSPDGRAYRTETLATTDGIEKINGGKVEFRGRNEQRASASHQGDDKNFVKKASESSNSHLEEHVVIGDENSGRTEMKTSSTKTSSSTHATSSSSTVEYGGGEPLDGNYLMDNTNRQQYQQQQRLTQDEFIQQQQQQHQQRQQELQQQEFEQIKQYKQQQQQQQKHEQRQYTEEFNRNRQESTTSRNVDTQQTTEHSRRVVDMDKASPEYQQHVQHLMAQPGEIISNTVEYPKPNVKMITTVKRLPDGTIVKNKRYETEELKPTLESQRQRTTSTTSQSSTQQRNEQQRRQQTEENVYNRQQNLHKTTTGRHEKDVVDNAESLNRAPHPQHQQQLVQPHSSEHFTDEVSNVETKFSSTKKSSRRFSTETTSETIEEFSDQVPPANAPGVRGKPSQDFSTHGFPSVRPNKPTQEYPGERPHAAPNTQTPDFSTHGFPSVRPNKPTQEYPGDRSRPSSDVEYINQRTVTNTNTQKSPGYPVGGPNTNITTTTDGDVVMISSESTRSSKYKTNSEHITETEVIIDGDTTPVGRGTPSTYEPQGTPRRPQPTEDFSTHGFPSVRDVAKPSSTPPTTTRQINPDGSVTIVSSETKKTIKHNANREHIVETEIVGDHDYRSTPATRQPDTITFPPTPQPSDFSTHGFPSVRDSAPTNDAYRRQVTPTREHPTSPRKPQSSEDFSTHGFPSVRTPTTKPTPDYSTPSGGYPGTKNTMAPKLTPTPPRAQPTTTSTRKPTTTSTTTTTDSSQRLISKERDVDASHRAFAASLRCSSPVDSIDHHHHQRMTPRSSVSSTRTFRRDGREGSHDSDTSRISTGTVTRSSPSKSVGKTVVTKQTTVLKNRNVNNGSNETIDLTPQRHTKSPSPSKNITTTTRTTTTTTTNARKSPGSGDVPKRTEKSPHSPAPSNHMQHRTHPKATSPIRDDFEDVNHDESIPNQPLSSSPIIEPKQQRNQPNKNESNIERRTVVRESTFENNDWQDTIESNNVKKPYPLEGDLSKPREKQPINGTKPHDEYTETITMLVDETPIDTSDYSNRTPVDRKRPEEFPNKKPQSKEPISKKPNDCKPQFAEPLNRKSYDKQPRELVAKTPGDRRPVDKTSSPTRKTSNASVLKVSTTATSTTKTAHQDTVEDDRFPKQPNARKPSETGNVKPYKDNRSPTRKPDESAFEPDTKGPKTKKRPSVTEVSPTRKTVDNRTSKITTMETTTTTRKDSREPRNESPVKGRKPLDKRPSETEFARDEHSPTRPTVDTKKQTTTSVTTTIKKTRNDNVSPSRNSKPADRIPTTNKVPITNRSTQDRYPEENVAKPESSDDEDMPTNRRPTNKPYPEEVVSNVSSTTKSMHVKNTKSNLVTSSVEKNIDEPEPTEPHGRKPFSKKPFNDDYSDDDQMVIRETTENITRRYKPRQPFDDNEDVEPLPTKTVKKGNEPEQRPQKPSKAVEELSDTENQTSTFITTTVKTLRPNKPQPTHYTTSDDDKRVEELFIKTDNTKISKNINEEFITFERQVKGKTPINDKPIKKPLQPDEKKPSTRAPSQPRNSDYESSKPVGKEPQPASIGTTESSDDAEISEETYETTTTITSRKDLRDDSSMTPVVTKEPSIPYDGPDRSDRNRIKKPIDETNSKTITTTTITKNIAERKPNRPNEPTKRGPTADETHRVEELFETTSKTRSTKNYNEVLIDIESQRRETPDGAFISKAPEPEPSSPSYKKKGVSPRETFEDRCRQILGMEEYGDTPGSYKQKPDDKPNETEEVLVNRTEFEVRIEDCEDDEPNYLNNIKEAIKPQKQAPKTTTTYDKPKDQSSNEISDEDLVEDFVEEVECVVKETVVPLKRKSPEKESYSEITRKSTSKTFKQKTTDEEEIEITKQTKKTTPRTKNKNEDVVPEESICSESETSDEDIDNESQPDTVLSEREFIEEEERAKLVVNTKKNQPTNGKCSPVYSSPNTSPTRKPSEPRVSGNTTPLKQQSSPTFGDKVQKIFESKPKSREPLTPTTKKMNDTKPVTKTPERPTSPVKDNRKPNKETPNGTIKDRLRSSTRNHKPSEAESDSSPAVSPTRLTERRRSSNISVHTEIIIDHSAPKSPKPNEKTPEKHKPQSKKTVPTDNNTSPSKPFRRLPVTERKESAPVPSVTRKDKNAKMTRSTSEQVVKVTEKPEKKKTEVDSLTHSPSPSPKSERRPNKCFTTKTINLTTTDKRINTHEMENVIIDIQHAKSSREPSPDKIVPTPVPVHMDTGKPRYPDVVQEPEDEPRKKPIIKNIPIFEEESNEFVNCHITEIKTDKRSKLVDLEEDDILINPTIEAPKSLDYPSIDRPDDDCLLSVHEKVSKFTHTAEEIKKPKASSPFSREFDKAPNVPDNDDCLLTVDEKVNKFIKTAEDVTKPTTPVRDIERPNYSDLDVELRRDDCTLTVSQKVNKFLSTAEKLAPTTPQRSPELVAKIERTISKQSEPEYPEDVSDEELAPFTQNHTIEIEKRRQKDILSRPTVFENNRKTDRTEEKITITKHTVGAPDDDDDEFVPHTKDHTTKIELKRQKDILARPSIYDNNTKARPQSPMKREPTGPHKPQQVIENKTTREHTTRKIILEDTNRVAVNGERKPSTSAGKPEIRKSPIKLQTSTVAVTKSRFEIPDNRKPIAKSPVEPITKRIPSSGKPNRKPTHEPTQETPITTSTRKLSRETDTSSTFINKRKPTVAPEYQSPQRGIRKPSTEPDSKYPVRKQSTDTEININDCETFESETEFVSSTTRRRSSSKTKDYLETVQTEIERFSPQQKEPIHTIPSPENPKSKTLSHSPTRSGTTTSTNKVTKVIERTIQHNSPSDSSDIEIIETIVERPEKIKTSTSTSPIGRTRITTDTVAARRNIFENGTTSKDQKPFGGSNSPSPVGRRPSYMDHTVSSLEHIRRDSLEVIKQNYSRKSSVESESNYERRPNAAVKFDVPQKPQRTVSIPEDIDVESIFELEVLERLLETVTSYELRRRIRAQIRLVKKNLLNTETIEKKQNETKTTSKSISSTHKASSTYKSNMHHEETDTIHGEIKTKRLYDTKSSPRRPMQPTTSGRVPTESVTAPHKSPYGRTVSPKRVNEEEEEEVVTTITTTYEKIPNGRSESPKRNAKSPHERQHSPDNKTAQGHVKEVRRTSGSTHKEYVSSEQTDYTAERIDNTRHVDKTLSERYEKHQNAQRSYSPESKSPVRDGRKSVDVKTKPSSSPRTKSPDSGKPSYQRTTSPQGRTPKQRDDLYTTSKVTKIKTTRSPERKSSKPNTDENTPIWADRKNLLKSPTGSPRKVPASPAIRTTATKTTTAKQTSQRLTSQNRNVEEDSITSSYGIGPTDENGLPLFGIKALKKKKPSQPCETTEEVTGYVIEEKYYSDSKTKPKVERKEYIYSTNADELEEIKKTVEQSRKSSRDDVDVIRKFEKIEKDYVFEKPDAIMPETEEFSSTSSKYVRRGSVKELSEKFIRKESSQSITEKSGYPKAGLILRTSRGSSAEPSGDTYETTTEKYTTTTSNSSGQGYRSVEGDSEDEQNVQLRQKQSRRLFTEFDDNEQNEECHMSTRSSTKSTRSFLNSSGETKIVTSVDDALERMRNADNVVEAGDTAEDREARSLLNKFLGASVIMKGVESVLPATKQIKTTTITKTSYADDDGDSDLLRNKAVKTTRITKTTKSGSSSTPVTRTTCDIEEICDEEFLKELLEQATTYEERRKIRTRLRDLMAEREEQQATSTTEKTETKEKDGAVVTTTTKVTTRTVSGTGSSATKPASPFAKFRQLDKQNSQQSPKSPSTPTTPGGKASPSGSARIFQFTDPALNARAATAKEQLLQWCQSKTQEYENIKITNFSASWSDGLAFCALIHHFLPDAFDYSQLTSKNRRHNFELAFTVADEKAGIAPLLDVEDMVDMQRPDWKCVFIYVQSIYRRFRNCQ